MTKWINSPLQDIIKATEKLYGELDCKIEIVQGLKRQEKALGLTSFCEDGEVIVSLDANLPYIRMCEILAHELSHVINGENSEEHGKKWKEIFDSIHREFERGG